jgi:hypothetical protein
VLRGPHVKEQDRYLPPHQTWVSFPPYPAKG